MASPWAKAQIEAREEALGHATQAGSGQRERDLALSLLGATGRLARCSTRSETKQGRGT